jgi:arsenical pump membrane protein
VLGDAVRQVWPAFLLVTGLLLVGLTASSDRLFLRAGALLERMPGPPAALLIAGMLLLACVTAVLNLDTAVVFLTPVLIAAAARRRVPVAPFLFSSIFIANASSLYLPGSNLTNLLVLGQHHISGGTFARQMFAPALVATLATCAGLLVLFRPELARVRAGAGAGGAREGGAGGREESASGREEDESGRSIVGLTATLIAAGLTVAFRNPALPVLGTGLAGLSLQITRRRLTLAEVLRGVGPLVLIALFCLSVGLGVLARSWSGPAQLLGGAGRWGTAGIGALASVALNNLPAAVLLSARPLAHPRALLLGLNLGPNLAVSGSLSSYLWFKAAAQAGQRPSVIRFSRLGVLLAPAAILLALLAAGLFSTPT